MHGLKIKKSCIFLFVVLSCSLIWTVNEDDWVIVPSSKEAKRTIFEPKIAARAVSKSPVRDQRLEIKKVDVLQQKTDEPWMVRGVDLETKDDGAIFGHPEMRWKNVRMADGTNCGYHALKNLRIFMDALDNRSINVNHELGKPRSELNRQLHNLDELLQHIPEWTTEVYGDRKEKVKEALRRKKIEIPDHDEGFKVVRSALPDSLKSYVNSNNGHIKTDDLDGQEVENLLKNENPALKDHVIVLEYIPGMPLEVMLTEAMQKQITEFKRNPNGRLGIVWNEEGFHHWVAYVAEKKNEKLTIYEMNSTKHKIPAHVPELLKLLQN